MTSKPHSALADRAGASVAAAASAPAAAPGPFVINLCSANTPMSLQQVQIPALARFTFFMSRRLEDGRERFRLHMGYFATQAEADEWLPVVREVFPSAWVGEAPGKRLPQVARAAGQLGSSPAAPAPASASAPAAAPPQAPPASTASPAPSSKAPATSPAQPPVRTASPSSAPSPAAPAAAKAVPRPASGAAPSVAPSAAAAPRAAVPPAKPQQAARPAASAAQAAPAAATAPPASAAAASPASAAASPPASTAAADATAGSNIREVLAELDSSGDTRIAPRPALPEDPEAALTDTQVLRMLERRNAGDAPPPRDVATVPLLKPDDTGTRQALREAVQSNAPVSFSVQLHWSVQPIDLSKVPPLAIFSAYTLYTVEGSREGRKWYGLRLGFFTDVIAAKQVAHYVRSEFASVAIVPVSAKEKSRALGGQPRPVGKSAPLAAKKTDVGTGENFELIEEPPRQLPTRDFDEVSPAAALAAAASPRPQGAGSRAASATPAAAPAPKARGGRVKANARRPPETLEETLEILGASALQMQVEKGNGKPGARSVRAEPQKSSPFTRLMDRLADRLNKG